MAAAAVAVVFKMYVQAVPSLNFNQSTGYPTKDYVNFSRWIAGQQLQISHASCLPRHINLHLI
jgi:hypothetical protein